MQGWPAGFHGHRVDDHADVCIRRRQLGKPFLQRLEIEHCAAGEQRHVVAFDNAAHRLQSVFAELCRRIAFGRVYEVDQMVWHLEPVARSGFAVPMFIRRYTIAPNPL